jgi:hypothetical protein
MRRTFEVQVSPDGNKRFSNGELRYMERISVLKVSGNYYDMEIQYGVLMREINKVKNV